MRKGVKRKSREKEKKGEWRRSRDNKRHRREGEKKIDREQWKRENVLDVEDLDILLIIAEMWEKRNWYQHPQINLKSWGAGWCKEEKKVEVKLEKIRKWFWKKKEQRRW